MRTYLIRDHALCVTLVGVLPIGQKCCSVNLKFSIYCTKNTLSISLQVMNKAGKNYSISELPRSELPHEPGAILLAFLRALPRLPRGPLGLSDFLVAGGGGGVPRGQLVVDFSDSGLLDDALTRDAHLRSGQIRPHTVFRRDFVLVEEA